MELIENMKPSHLILICFMLAFAAYCPEASYGRSNPPKAYDGEFFQGYRGYDPLPSSKQFTENKIYETLFYKCLTIRSKFYLAKTTGNRWFKENPFKKGEWIGRLKDLGDISIELIQDLYRVNSSYRPVNWKSALLDPVFLPDEYALNDGNKRKDKYCFDEEGEGNVSALTKDMMEYRSYYIVSRVAFSKDRRYALVKYSRNCSQSSDDGDFFVSFKFTNNAWKCIGNLKL
jgi:hypothetical protein